MYFCLHSSFKLSLFFTLMKSKNVLFLNPENLQIIQLDTIAIQLECDV